MRNYHKTSVEGTFPCRYCGSTNTKIRHTRNNNQGRSGTMYAIACGNCYARGPIVKDLYDRNPTETINKAIAKWNAGNCKEAM